MIEHEREFEEWCVESGLDTDNPINFRKKEDESEYFFKGVKLLHQQFCKIKVLENKTKPKEYCKIIDAECEHLIVGRDRNNHVAISFCNHAHNPCKTEGNNNTTYCPIWRDM